jgi:hypothetical protein
MVQIPRFISGMSKPGIAFTRLPGTKNLLRRWPGPTINGGWLRAPSIDAFAFGMWAQVSAFAFLRVIGRMSARWNSTSRGNNCCLGPGTEWSAFGRANGEGGAGISNVSPGTRTSDAFFPARVISGFGTRKRVSACRCFTALATRFDPWPGVTIIDTLSRRPMTAPSGFGNRRRGAAFTCSKDTKPA